MRVGVKFFHQSADFAPWLEQYLVSESLFLSTNQNQGQPKMAQRNEKIEEDEKVSVM